MRYGDVPMTLLEVTMSTLVVVVLGLTLIDLAVETHCHGPARPCIERYGFWSAFIGPLPRTE
jgi:hypothetical protein